MPPADLLTLVRARPFVPFRLHMSDGTIYEVRHPELVVVTLGSAVVGYPDPSGSGLAATFDMIAVSHIVRVDFLRQEAAAGPANN